MDYVPPLNATATGENPRPEYFDGNEQTGQDGSYVSGRSIEHPMREVLAVIEGAGLTPTSADLTQLKQAIATMIAAAVSSGGGGGSGETLNFLLNPVYPYTTVNGGFMTVNAGSGSVELAAGQTFVYRGGISISTSDFELADRQFATLANKTYHLRWRYNAGEPELSLNDLADAGYNPGSLAETHQAFDTGFDDMLIARVVTNGSNVATITPLKNVPNMGVAELIAGTDGQLVGSNGASFAFAKVLNWARSPQSYSLTLAKSVTTNNERLDDFNIMAATATGSASALNATPPQLKVDRYGMAHRVMHDYSAEIHMHFTARA